MEITKEMLELATAKANHAQLIVMHDAIKAERDALKAHTEALKSAIKQHIKEKIIAVEKQRASELLLKKSIKVPVSYKGLVPFMVYDYDASLKTELNNYLCMSDDDWLNHLAEVRVQAVQEFANHACGECKTDSQRWLSSEANRYADQSRRGGGVMEYDKWAELAESREEKGATPLAPTLVEQLTADRDALAAQIEELKSACQLAIDMFKVNDINVPNTIETLEDAIDTTPQQHLAEIRAEAGRAGYLKGADDWKSFGQIFDSDIKVSADQYAETIRQGGAE